MSLDLPGSELRQAVRSLLRQPGFTAVALLSLAVGIGANTAVFSVVNALLFRPLPWREAERLVDVYEHHPTEVCAGCGIGTSYPLYRDLIAGVRTLDGLAAYRTGRVTIGTDEGAERHVGAYASATLFPLLGVDPLEGRAYTGQEDEPGADRVVVLGERLWRSSFAAADIVGRSIRINGTPHTVVGVMPDALAFPAFAQLWLPLAPAAAGEARSDRAIAIVARLAVPASLAAARAEMSARGAQLEREHAATNAGWTLHVMPLRAELTADYATSFLIMLAIVAFVLLVACLNLANLLLARASVRRQELAVRAALGATRGTLVRHLLMESLAISLAAGALGLLIAVWTLDGFRAVIPPDSLPGWIRYDIDVRVALFTCAAAIGTGVVFGLLPGLQATRVDVNRVLVEGQRGSTAARSTTGLRNVLVVVQVAAAMVLVFGAGFLANEFVRINRFDPGYSLDGLYSGQVSAAGDRYASPRAVAAVANELVARIGVNSGTDAVALSSMYILNWPGTPAVQVRAQDRADDVARAIHRVYNVTPGYFRTLGVPITAGRDFTAADAQGAAPVAIAGVALARELWPGQNPLGRQLHLGGPDDQWVTIVGTVPSARTSPFARDTSRLLYLPLAQHARSQPAGDQLLLHLRLPRGGTDLPQRVRAAVSDVDPDLVVENVSASEEHERFTAGPVRMSTITIGVLGSFAVLLAAMGIHGLIAFTVSQRLPEMGIRIALGATRAGIMRLIIRHALLLAGLGIGFGTLGAVALGDVLRSQMMGTRMPGPLTFAALIIGFMGVATLASWLPARHAGRVDPVAALRSE